MQLHGGLSKGQRSKVKDQGTKFRGLTCEHSRRGVRVPVVVEPVAVPVPPASAEVEVQDAPVAVGIAQNSSVEEDVLAFPFLWDTVLVFPERLEGLCVQADVLGTLEALELLVALDAGFVRLEHCHELDLGEVDFGEGQGAVVLILLSSQAVAVCRAAPDCPALADEGSRVEWLGAIDAHDVMRLTNRYWLTHFGFSFSRYSPEHVKFTRLSLGYIILFLYNLSRASVLDMI